MIQALAQAVSAQAEAATRTWLATLSIAVVILLPRPATSAIEPAVVELMWDLGSIPSNVFYPVVYAVLAVFSIALAAAHAQHMRVHRVAHDVVDAMEKEYEPSPTGIHPRDRLDILTRSGLTRVAPLAQWIRGRHQFWSQAQSAPVWLRGLSVVYYILLKVMVFAVLYALPGLALWYGRAKVSEATQGGTLWALTTVGVVAGASLAIVSTGELAYVWRVVKLLASGDEPDKATKAT